MIKKFFALSMAGLLTLTISAQTKKPAAKPVAVKSTTTTNSGGINASNYGKVVQYLNTTIDCMNSQGDAISYRRNIINEMYKIYVTRDAKYVNGGDLTVFTPSMLKFNYADEKAGSLCGTSQPPSIMNADDVKFYATNYPATQQAFIALTKLWNETATSVDNNSVSNYTLDQGKKKYEEIEAAMDNYFTIRKSISSRTRAIQKSLFPFSVAKSPAKKQYINMNDDVTAIQDFMTNMTDYTEIQKNKEAIAAALVPIEEAAIRHSTEMPAEGSGMGSFNYKSFYSNVNDFIDHTKQLLNGTVRDRDQKKVMDRNTYYYQRIISEYNSIMSH